MTQKIHFEESATKKHKRHKTSDSFLCLLCFFVAEICIREVQWWPRVPRNVKQIVVAMKLHGELS